jgi:hypothetical protein
MGEISYVNVKITVHSDTKLTYEPDYGVPFVAGLSAEPLTRITIERLARWVDEDTFRCRELLQLLGKHLYHCMFGGPGSKVHESFQAAVLSLRKDANKDKRLRITLTFEKPADSLARYPWEFLHVDGPDDDGFFIAAASTPTQLILTRLVPPPAQIVNSLEPEDRPLRILVVVSSPPDPQLSAVNADKLQVQLEKLRGEQRVDLRILKTPRYEEIKAELQPRDGRPWWPHIFHFVGHGEVREEDVVFALRMNKSDEDYLYAQEGQRALREWVSVRKLKELFPDDHWPRLVFLHACRGAARRSYWAFASGAETFVRAGVPAAIAMQYDISNEDADFFAQQFYERLGEGWPVDDAVTAGRVQLAQHSAPHSWGDRSFGTPLLFLQSKQAVILRPVTRRESQSKPVEGYPCPYLGCDRRFGRTDLGQCPKCARPLQWCKFMHPCMEGDQLCETCGARLTPSPTRGPSSEGKSGFD